MTSKSIRNTVDRIAQTSDALNTDWDKLTKRQKANFLRDIVLEASLVWKELITEPTEQNGHIDQTNP